MNLGRTRQDTRYKVSFTQTLTISVSERENDFQYINKIRKIEIDLDFNNFDKKE